MSEKMMQDIWEDLHEQPRFQPSYPHEIVVRWALQNFRSKPDATLLDIGCGTGRHSLFFAREGFTVFANDLSRSGVLETKRRAQQENLTLEVQANALHEIDYDPLFFDGIMSYGVFNYASYTEITEAVNKIYSFLKPGGKLLIVLRGEDDWRLNYAEKIAPYTYKMTELGEGTPSDVEQGMTQCYLDKIALENIFSAFSELKIDFLKLSWQNAKYCDHDYLIEAQK